MLQERMVAGRLHYFEEPGQKEATNKVYWGFLVCAGIVGFISNGVCTPIENIFSWWFRTDGMGEVRNTHFTKTKRN